ncbi:hypothetical protein T492DRAFT_382881 [Pavlovales sp. CCMP2436]|nr:hypothetical protein T492DRAFT_382881 [Pavlovales sp. CCMP2436]
MKRVAVPTDEMGRSRGFAHVGFEEESSAQQAIAFSGRTFAGREVRVEIATERPGPRASPYDRGSGVGKGASNFFRPNSEGGLDSPSVRRSFDRGADRGGGDRPRFGGGGDRPRPAYGGGDRFAPSGGDRPRFGGGGDRFAPSGGDRPRFGGGGDRDPSRPMDGFERRKAARWLAQLRAGSVATRASRLRRGRPVRGGA